MDLKRDRQLFRKALIEGYEASVEAFRAINWLLISLQSETSLEKQVRTVIDYTNERCTRAFKKNVRGYVNGTNK